MSYAIVASFAGSYRSKLASSPYCILEHGNNLYENCAYSPKEHISLFLSQYDPFTAFLHVLWNEIFCCEIHSLSELSKCMDSEIKWA